QRVRVAAALEAVLGELRRRRQRAGLGVRTVAVDAQPGVDRLAAAEALAVQGGDQAGVVEVGLVLGQPQGVGRRRRLERLRPVRPSFVTTVTDSNPLRMTLDGNNTDSMRCSSVASGPGLVRSGPSGLGPPSTAWHLRQPDCGRWNTTAPRPASPLRRAARASAL